MRLAIYVPQRQARQWDPRAGFLSWETFLKRLASTAGNVYVHTAAGHWNGREGYATEPVFIAEAWLDGGCARLGCHTYGNTWALLREYAHALIERGEDSILIVQDNEPTLVKHQHL